MTDIHYEPRRVAELEDAVGIRRAEPEYVGHHGLEIARSLELHQNGETGMELTRRRRVPGLVVAVCGLEAHLQPAVPGDGRRMPRSALPDRPIDVLEVVAGKGGPGELEGDPVEAVVAPDADVAEEGDALAPGRPFDDPGGSLEGDFPGFRGGVDSSGDRGQVSISSRARAGDRDRPEGGDEDGAARVADEWISGYGFIVGGSHASECRDSLMVYRAVDIYVYNCVRHILTRRYKMPGRGTRRFSDEVVFGELGGLSLRARSDYRSQLVFSVDHDVDRIASRRPGEPSAGGYRANATSWARSIP